MSVENIIGEAASKLSSKTFGGVSKESAMEAIKTAVEKVAKAKEEAVAKVTQELQAYKGKTAQEMADLTSQKDKFQTLAQQEAQRADKAEGIIEKLSKYTKTKTGKAKQLSNGNNETVKVNKNGARMTTEQTPEGKVIQKTVETIDGDIRKTTFDPVLGKPVKTFTNVNGDKIIEYTKNGAKIKNVNIKKIKAQKPKLISNEIVGKDNSGNQLIKKTYSDGTYEDIIYDPNCQIPLSTKKYNSKGKLIEASEIAVDSRTDAVLYKEKTINNPATNLPKETVLERSNGLRSNTYYTDTGKPYKKVEKTKNGLKRIIKGKVDEYGNVNTSNPTMKYIYPKNSQIKESKIDFESRFYANKETLKMKDGSTVTMGINSRYVPYNVTIEKPGADPIVLERNEGLDYLNMIGKVGYEQDNKYFHNSI